MPCRKARKDSRKEENWYLVAGTGTFLEHCWRMESGCVDGRSVILSPICLWVEGLVTKDLGREEHRAQQHVAGVSEALDRAKVLWLWKKSATVRCLV